MIRQFARNELQKEILNDVWTLGCKIATQDLEHDEIHETLGKWISDVDDIKYSEAIIGLNKAGNSGELWNPDMLLLALLPIIKNIEDNRCNCCYEDEYCCELTLESELEEVEGDLEEVKSELEDIKKENELLKKLLKLRE